MRGSERTRDLVSPRVVSRVSSEADCATDRGNGADRRGDCADRRGDWADRRGDCAGRVSASAVLGTARSLSPGCSERRRPVRRLRWADPPGRRPHPTGGRPAGARRHRRARPRPARSGAAHADATRRAPRGGRPPRRRTRHPTGGVDPPVRRIADSGETGDQDAVGELRCSPGGVGGGRQDDHGRRTAEPGVPRNEAPPAGQEVVAALEQTDRASRRPAARGRRADQPSVAGLAPEPKLDRGGRTDPGEARDRTALAALGLRAETKSRAWTPGSSPSRRRPRAGRRRDPGPPGAEHAETLRPARASSASSQPTVWRSARSDARCCLVEDRAPAAGEPEQFDARGGRRAAERDAAAVAAVELEPREQAGVGQPLESPLGAVSALPGDVRRWAWLLRAQRAAAIHDSRSSSCGSSRKPAGPAGDRQPADARRGVDGDELGDRRRGSPAGRRPGGTVAVSMESSAAEQPGLLHRLQSGATAAQSGRGSAERGSDRAGARARGRRAPGRRVPAGSSASRSIRRGSTLRGSVRPMNGRSRPARVLQLTTAVWRGRWRRTSGAASVATVWSPTRS